MTLLPSLSLLCPLEVPPEAEVKLYLRKTAFFRTRSSNSECTTSLHKLLQRLITFTARKLHLISRLITSNLKLPVTGFSCAFVSKSKKAHSCYLFPVSSHSFREQAEYVQLFKPPISRLVLDMKNVWIFSNIFSSVKCRHQNCA